MKTALIAGATGLTGSHLLSLLLESKGYQKIYVLSRRSIEIDHPKAELILSDLEQAGAGCCRYNYRRCILLFGYHHKNRRFKKRVKVSGLSLPDYFAAFPARW